jgi:hypothetical protein
MSTNSSIAKLQPDGSVKEIYCHWDGHPSSVGKTLMEHYTTEEKVDQLIALGNISVLGKEIGSKQDFDNPVKDTCVVYGRDRDEVNMEANHFANPQDWHAYCNESHYEYSYLFLGETIVPTPWLITSH